MKIQGNKEMRHFITYLKNGLEMNLNDSFIFVMNVK